MAFRCSSRVTILGARTSPLPRTSTREVSVETCDPNCRQTLGSLFQLYTHDFSEQWAGQARGELGEDGRFPDYPNLDSYWSDPTRHPYLIRADGYLAGFALINDHSHANLPLDHAVAEFFVVRKHRRSGVGRIAALQLIGDRPGQWEMAVARANIGALTFWRGVTKAVGRGVEELDRNDEHWNGAILRFVVA